MKVKHKTKRKAAYLRAVIGYRKSFKQAYEHGVRLLDNPLHPFIKQIRRSVMGYRSDVAMCIKSKDKPSFDQFCAQLKLWAIAERDGKLFAKWEPECWGWDDKYIAFYTQNTKWYDDYPEVQEVENLWKFCENCDELVSGTFLRIGEEGNDIEERCFGIDPPWEEMKLYRTIDVDESRVPLGKASNDVLGTIKEREEAE